MNGFRNEILIEGIVEKNDGLILIDKYGSQYAKFILAYPRTRKVNNHFRCRAIKNSKLVKRITQIPIGTKIRVQGELIDYFSPTSEIKTSILVHNFEITEK